MLWSARSGRTSSPTLRTPWPASTLLSTPTPTPRSPTCPGWSQRTPWTAWGTSPTSPSRPRWRPWQWWWLESDDSDVFRTEKASSAPGTRTGRSPGSTGPGTEAGRWTIQYASSVWFNKNIMLSVEENSFFLNKLHISLWLAYFYYAMQCITVMTFHRSPRNWHFDSLLTNVKWFLSFSFMTQTRFQMFIW